MSKATFRNDSAGTIYLEEYGHQRVVVSEVVTVIDDNQETKFADSTQLNTLITTGDLVYIDDLGADRTVAGAMQILEGMRDKVIVGGNSGDLLCTNSTGDLVWTSIVGSTISFAEGSVTTDKWLKTEKGDYSNQTPAIMPFPAKIYSLTYVNNNNSSDMDFVFYKNGAVFYTWSMVDKRWAYKTNGLSALTFAVGDRLSIFAKNVGGLSPHKPQIIVQLSFTDGTTGEGGSATGV